MTENAEKIVRPKVQTTVRLDADLHESLRDRVHSLGKGLAKRDRPSIDSVVQEAIRTYLLGSLHQKASPSGEISSIQAEKSQVLLQKHNEFPEQHQRLERILRGGVVREAIEHNLKAFDRLTELEHGAGGPDPGTAGPDLEQGLEQAGEIAEEAGRLLGVTQVPRKRVRNPKTKHPKKASGGSGN